MKERSARHDLLHGLYEFSTRLMYSEPPPLSPGCLSVQHSGGMTRKRVQRTYDHRLVRLVGDTGGVSIATRLGVPRSMAAAEFAEPSSRSRLATTSSIRPQPCVSASRTSSGVFIVSLPSCASSARCSAQSTSLFSIDARFRQWPRRDFFESSIDSAAFAASAGSCGSSTSRLPDSVPGALAARERELEDHEWLAEPHDVVADRFSRRSMSGCLVPIIRLEGSNP